MQFRAGIFYVLLFAVVAAGAYGVIATAEAPEATIEEADADYQLAQGDELEVDGRTYNVSELGGGSGTAEYVNESAVLDLTWEDGDTVELEEGAEYTLAIPEPADNETDGEGNETDGEGNESDGESAPEAFTLREDYDDEEYETVERDDGEYVVVEEDGTTELVHIDDFDEIESRSYEVGDAVEFYDSESEQTVEGEVVEITGDSVTVEYEGTEVETFDLADGETVTLNGNEFAVFHPSDDEVYLSSDVSSFQDQQDDVSEFHDRITGLWWVVVLSVLTAVVLAALAFMPIRG